MEPKRADVHVLVGGVGYRNLRDRSVGVLVTDRLGERPWPDGVAVEDLSYNPVAVVQRLEDEPAGALRRLLLVSGVSRPGREPGQIDAYRWDGALPSPDRIQDAVAEAITGVISLDNTLVVAGHFRALPPEVLVVEMEPGTEEFGEDLAPHVAAAFEDLCALVTRLATDDDVARSLPAASLGGGRLVSGA